MIIGHRGSVRHGILAAVFHAGEDPVFLVESDHDTGLVIIRCEITRYLDDALKVTGNFLPVEGSIINGPMQYPLSRFAPAIGTLRYFDDQFVVFDRHLFVWFIVPTL